MGYLGMWPERPSIGLEHYRNGPTIRLRSQVKQRIEESPLNARNNQFNKTGVLKLRMRMSVKRRDMKRRTMKRIMKKRMSWMMMIEIMMH